MLCGVKRKKRGFKEVYQLPDLSPLTWDPPPPHLSQLKPSQVNDGRKEGAVGLGGSLVRVKGSDLGGWGGILKGMIAGFLVTLRHVCSCKRERARVHVHTLPHTNTCLNSSACVATPQKCTNVHICVIVYTSRSVCVYKIPLYVCVCMSGLTGKLVRDPFFLLLAFHPCARPSSTITFCLSHKQPKS